MVAGVAVCAEFKPLDEPLREFIVRKGGINKCAARFARRLGRSPSKRLLKIRISNNRRDGMSYKPRYLFL